MPSAARTGEGGDEHNVAPAADEAVRCRTISPFPEPFEFVGEQVAEAVGIAHVTPQAVGIRVRLRAVARGIVRVGDFLSGILAAQVGEFRGGAIAREDFDDLFRGNDV